MSSEPLLSVRGVSKRYELYDKPRDRLLQFVAGGRRQYFRELWALKDISFDVTRGESLGLIGQNGSGKSTLLQIVTGTLSPTQGSVRTQGRIAALLELGAGFNTEFTGRENVYMNAAILGVSREQMAARMEQVLEFSELGDFIDRPVKTYSSGMYARLAFSAAIHVDPELLIVDETLAVGDARFVAKCMRRIRELQAGGTSIVFVSHDVTAVRTLCDRAVWLHKGQLVEDGGVFPVTGRYMESMFGEEAGRSSEVREAPAQTVSSSASAGQPTNTLAVDDGQVMQPVTHWGSHMGTIRGAALRDGTGCPRSVVAWGEQVEAVVQVRIPDDVPREQLNIAVSIKDLRGTDLLVCTSHDVQPHELPRESGFEVTFSFRNCLTPGRYLLVAAVERRQDTDIHYYEYLEGAHYFASTSEWMMAGVFRPDVQVHVRTKAELISE